MSTTPSPALADEGRKGGVSRLAGFAYGLSALVIVLDQISKYWILEVFRLPERGSVEILPFFSLSMVWNRGVSFGLFQAQAEVVRWALALFSFAVAVALVLWARKVERPLLALSLGLVIGGAVGNLIDRVRFGAVADFIDVSRLYFPWVFNVADSAITVGVLLLILDSLRPHAPLRPESRVG